MVQVKMPASSILASSHKVPSAKAESDSDLIRGTFSINGYREGCLIIQFKALEGRPLTVCPVHCPLSFEELATLLYFSHPFWFTSFIFNEWLYKTIGL